MSNRLAVPRLTAAQVAMIKKHLPVVMRFLLPFAVSVVMASPWMRLVRGLLVLLAVGFALVLGFAYAGIIWLTMANPILTLACGLSGFVLGLVIACALVKATKVRVVRLVQKHLPQ